MSDFMVPTSASTPLRPNLPSRVLLGLIRWQERRKKRLPKKGAGQNSSAQGQGGAQAQAQPVATLPEQQHFLKILRKAMDTPSFPQRLSALPLRRVVRVQVPGATGPLAARLYIPHGRVRGAVLYLHGGGFVHCGLNSHHGICCRLARASGAAVLLPDYALAPENPFPAAVEDSRAALVWLAGASARHWGGQVAVAGDSAGGNLAAVLAQNGRAGLCPNPALQLLYYPSLYGRNNLPSQSTYEDGYFLSRRSMEWYAAQYIQREEDWTHPHFVPGHTADLGGLAPAVIVTAACDPMRDEGQAYASALKRAGVPVLYRCYPGTLHAFLNFYALMPHGKAALRLGGRALRKAFAASA
ncbi:MULTISPECIES: alpha/beta hydrolase [Acetobacter]|jgi:acetyl esterase|uniref:Acetyl esterase n=2 Tax=Acetobacter TaxID=434 RepID=A0A841QCK2_9PROT|nr:alpha/beta hydrolase [Acetobacter lovaniensis]MBB6456125.1 acetyl esterase [Acetobacter lovaniensis]MCI1698166.1 alpha/beta hydrolase [Acetobacter lovaniensis]MCI1794577.1 alpha/beta hydrolase [Acetobacter lovaniensis]MCP1238961.1 alpha/beta hydrolase [Acetobacter lovaniensis]NHN80505.1 alpha/beta hydrolase fold domain-containing protein [Acetobacter lovaniensis]